MSAILPYGVCSVKVIIPALADPALAEAAARTEFVKYCNLFDLKPEDFGKTFRTSQGDATLVGLELKRRKYPLKIRRAGKVVLMTTDVVDRIKAA